MRPLPLTEIQRFPPAVLIVIVCLTIGASLSVLMTSTSWRGALRPLGLVILSGQAAAALYFVASMKTRLCSRGVSINRFLVGRTFVPYDQIARVSLETPIPPDQGHISQNFRLRSNNGICLHLASGETIAVGSNAPTALARAIDARQRGHGDAACAVSPN